MMKMPATTAETKAGFDDIVKRLAPVGVTGGAMFGMPAFKAGSKSFGGVFGDELVFKLGGDAHARALALAGARLFDPSGMGRAMKEWVVVPRSHAAAWPGLAEAAFAYATGATKAKPIKAKPTKAKPTKTKPTKARPAKAKPAKAKPAKAKPAKAKRRS